MKVFIRVDASEEIGSGHLMRCLTLAKSLSNHANQIIFIIRTENQSIVELVEKEDFKVETLSIVQEKLWAYTKRNWQQDAEECIEIIQSYNCKEKILIVDHYSLDIKWEEKLRKCVNKIVVIDDLADRPHDCDIIIDQNYYANYERRYDNLVTKKCRKLLGPNYVILRNEFLLKQNEISIRDNFNRLLVFIGGSDPTNETEKIIHEIKPLMDELDIYADIIVGILNANKQQIEDLCNLSNRFTYYCQVNNISDLMLKADFAIGAGGATTWERCYLGLPSATIIIADNQKEITLNVEAYGATINLGGIDDPYLKGIQEMLREIKTKPSILNSISLKGMELIDGKGCERVVKEIVSC